MGDTLFKCNGENLPKNELDYQFGFDQTRPPFTQPESRDARLPGLRSNPSMAVQNLPPVNRGKHY